MLRSSDGRTVLYGHLDAFEEPVASWVAAAQESTARYEQDLSPEPNRFPVRAGQRVAWSGDSGAGPPHLHMEVRWGDLSYNPLRYGLSLPDVHAPELRRVTLEPVAPDSWVDRSAAPRTYVLSAVPETVVVEGAVRVWLEAADGVSDARARAVPHAAAIAWEGKTLECRFDRVMWDDDMTAVEWVYDGTGRAAPGRAIGLWAAPEYRPSVFGPSPWDGVLQVEAGAPPRSLELRASDAAGNVAQRSLVIRGPNPEERGPGVAVPQRQRRAVPRGLEVTPVLQGAVRVTYGGHAIPAGTSDVVIGAMGSGSPPRPASFDGRRWSAVLPAPAAERSGPSQFGVADRNASAVDSFFVPSIIDVSPASPARVSAPGDAGYTFDLPARGAFGRGVLMVDSVSPAPPLPGLQALGPAWRVGPARQPLRLPATVTLPLPATTMRDRAGVYYERDRSWIWADSKVQGDRIEAEVRALTRYAVYADVAAPQVGLARTHRRVGGAPHSRWSVHCAVIERGSGLNSQNSYWIVDGRRMPSEWEVERAVLRWRPLQPPAPGVHRYEVVATDRAGNTTRRTGTFTVR
jgi:hypothetical protein